METKSSWYVKNFWGKYEILETYLYYDSALVFTVRDEWWSTFFLYIISEDKDCEYYICKFNYEEDLKKLLNKEIDVYRFLTTNLEEDSYRIWKINKFTGEMNEYYVPRAVLSEKEFIPNKGVFL